MPNAAPPAVPSDPDPDPDPAAAVRAREREWVAVYLRKDAAAFAALMTDDFVYTSERGVFGRDAYVDNLRTGEIAMRGFTTRDVETRVHGDAVVATGVADLDASFRGRDISGPERYTRVWVRGADGGWRAAALHASAAPGDASRNRPNVGRRLTQSA